MLKWLVNHLVKGYVQATKFITTGGTPSDFVKGDGSLDGTTYALDSDLGNYVPKYSLHTNGGDDASRVYPFLQTKALPEATIDGVVKLETPIDININLTCTFTLDIHNDLEGLSSKIFVSFLVYQNSIQRETVFNICSNELAGYRVRIGELNGKVVVYLGDNTTTWRYANISIEDLHFGWTSSTNSNLVNGWDFTVEGSVDENFISGYDAKEIFPYGDWNKLKNKPSDVATESWTNSNFDNYQSWNLKTNGTQRTTIQSGDSLDLVAGNNTTLQYSAGGQVTINSSFNDTTYTAGTGLDLTGTEFSFDTAWGDSRYLQSFTETDPIFQASPAAGITSTNIANWITAFGWGNHANAGYALTSQLFSGSFGDLTGVPTTLSGYGITDAYTQGQINSLLNNKADKTTVLSAGTGLTGGGSLAADRTFSVDFTEVATSTQGDKADSAFSWGNWSTGVNKTFVDNLNVDADTLDGQHGSYYLNYNNFTNKPDLSALQEIEYANDFAALPTTGDADRVYITTDNGYMYRWNGSGYSQLTDQTAIWGQVSGTLSDQTDLQNALNSKATPSDIKDGTLTLSTGTGLTGSDTFSANQSSNTTFTVGLSRATQNSLAKADSALQVVNWGDIGGALSNQTDLQNALDGKFDNPTGTSSDFVKGDGSLDATEYSTQTDINSSIDNIEIGGRNLILNSNEYVDANVTDVLNGVNFRRVSYSWGYKYNITLPKGTYTFSVLAYNPNDVESIARASFGGGYNYVDMQSGELKLITRTVTFSEEYSGVNYILTNSGNESVAFSYFKIEKGNKATDWTPAPEDQITDWDETNPDAFRYLKNKPTKLSDFTNDGFATETWADNKFLLNTTDTLDGDLTVTGQVSANGGNSNQWNDAYNSIISDISPGFNGDLDISRPNSSNYSRTIKSIKVLDARNDWDNTDGSNGYMPKPNDSNLDKSLTGTFSYDWGGGSWGGVLTMKAWGTSYAAWQISGNASTSTKNDFYLRSGIGTTWDSWNRIWHSGDFDIADYATENYVNNAVFSGDYNDLSSLPTIPTNNNQLTNGAGYITSSALNGLATETYVDDEIANLVDSSPSTLDTLNELAAALGDDPNFATTVSNQIGLKADKSTSILTGTGLTGGGTLAADRTLSVNFGTSSGTVARGNDSRFHSHSNKSVLDGISSSDVSSWDDKQDKLLSGTIPLLNYGTDTTDRVWSANDLAIWGINSFIQRSMLDYLATEQYVDDAIAAIPDATIDNITDIPLRSYNDLQDKLTAGDGISISTSNVISSTGDSLFEIPNPSENGKSIKSKFSGDVLGEDQIVIGRNATAVDGVNSIAIGTSAEILTNSDGSIAIGALSNANHGWSIALGKAAKTFRVGELSLSSSSSQSSINNAYVAGVRTPEFAYDAANKDYVDQQEVNYIPSPSSTVNIDIREYKSSVISVTRNFTINLTNLPDSKKSIVHNITLKYQGTQRNVQLPSGSSTNLFGDTLGADPTKVYLVTIEAINVSNSTNSVIIYNIAVSEAN